MRDAIEFFFFEILHRFVHLFPFAQVQRMGSAFGRFAYSVLKIRKSLVMENLTKAFPEKTIDEIERIAQGAYKNLFSTFFEILYLDKITNDEIRRIVQFPEPERIHQLLQQKKGLIILTGHFANWEFAAQSTACFVPEDYTVIVQKQRNKYIDRFMCRMRTRFGAKLVVMEKAFRESFTALKNNHIVALIADQSGPEHGIFVDYFGRPTSTHQGPAVFQVRTGAPMLLVMLVRKGINNFHIELEEIDLTGISGTQDEMIVEITRRHTAALEKFVRRYPEQWLWFHKRWKHTESYLRRLEEEKIYEHNKS